MQRRLADLAMAGRWRSAYAYAARSFLEGPKPVLAALGWVLGPLALGRPDPLDVLPIDTDAEDAHDARPELGRIACPTLVVTGGRDTLCPPSLSDELVAGIPGARQIVVRAGRARRPGRALRPRRLRLPGGLRRRPRRSGALVQAVPGALGGQPVVGLGQQRDDDRLECRVAGVEDAQPPCRA